MLTEDQVAFLHEQAAQRRHIWEAHRNHLMDDKVLETARAIARSQYYRSIIRKPPERPMPPTPAKPEPCGTCAKVRAAFARFLRRLRNVR